MLAPEAARTFNRAVGTRCLGTVTTGGDPTRGVAHEGVSHPPPQATACGGGWDARWSYGVTLAT